ncbi:Oidioi.mRNA.OKI2018_I69.chr2.g4913.t1.cds [Oikopleura dioica]|uniref:RING-type E3 ubiquitin transferase n=1 Tax=Oikopleura dioica TaxID=34765 RepID=A0ABN7SYI7_OIKDI|nr:Oidioi.mRNA.OKI2018_I69.chr2.g4913.t1.cds [Oikopleura dioica]
MGQRTSRPQTASAEETAARRAETQHQKWLREQRELVTQTMRFSQVDRPCPKCKKMQRAEEFETHLVCCLTKPALEFNTDVLEVDQGECIICYEDLLSQQVIARLPCLCIFHEHCLKDWFKVREECPSHPSSDD